MEGMEPRRRRRRKGQALVEFALVLPVLVIVLLGVVEVGRAWMVKQLVTNASREGAREGILPTSTVADVTSTVTAYLNAASITDGFTMQTVGVGGSATTGTTTQVTVSYNFPVLIGDLIPGFTGTIAISNTTVMRHE